MEKLKTKELMSALKERNSGLSIMCMKRNEETSG